MNEILLTVNGETVAAQVEPRMSLGDFLRKRQHLTGTHFGCEHGVCGACTVMINGAPARSCISFAVAVDRGDIRTVEGFENDAVMEAIRVSFHQEHALQCGFCTPGMLITARDIVTRFAEADEKRIRTELAGNLCRCTGYMGIVKAIQRVMREVPSEVRLSKSAPVPAPVVKPIAFRPFKAKQQISRQAAAPSAEQGTEDSLQKGWSRLSDSFTVGTQRTDVWRAFADLPRMAACMPGASLAQGDGDDFKGELRVSFGPIRAAFEVSATIERNDDTFTGVIRGSGNDPRTRSQGKGTVRYRLVDVDTASTQVVLTMDYQLQGPLAQFGRSGLVRDFVSRLIGEFARNLSDDLAGRDVDSSQRRELSAAGMVWSVLWARIRRLFQRRELPDPSNK